MGASLNPSLFGSSGVATKSQDVQLIIYVFLVKIQWNWYVNGVAWPFVVEKIENNNKTK
jgi:hypothetical protein